MHWQQAVRAQQNVETTRQTAEADRAKQVALIAAAAQDAETKAVETTVRAKAEKEAAELQAAAIVELAEATRKKGLAEAEAQRALNVRSTYFPTNKPASNLNWRFCKHCLRLSKNPLSR